MKVKGTNGILSFVITLEWLATLSFAKFLKFLFGLEAVVEFEGVTVRGKALCGWGALYVIS